MRIWGLWCSEYLIIMVFWGFDDFCVLRIWGLCCSEDVRILVFWVDDDFGVLKILRILVFRVDDDFGVLRIWGLMFFEDYSFENLKTMVFWGYEDNGDSKVSLFWRLLSIFNFSIFPFSNFSFLQISDLQFSVSVFYFYNFSIFLNVPVL